MSRHRRAIKCTFYEMYKYRLSARIKIEDVHGAACVIEAL